VLSAAIVSNAMAMTTLATVRTASQTLSADRSVEMMSLGVVMVSLAQILERATD
jgi:hypothetical protein